MDLPPGARFGPYEIVSPIAAGGMGEVYRGRDTRLEREVAVKVLPRGMATDPERVRRFQQEARGRRAFTGASAADTMSAVLREDPPELSLSRRAIPRELERIVRRCLEKSAAERFQSAQDLAFHLQTAAVSTSGPRLFLAGTRAWPWAALTVAALLAGLGAGTLVGLRSQPPLPSFKRLTFRRGLVAGARFAPDARTVVYDAAWEGQPGQVFSTRPESPESRTCPSRGRRERWREFMPSDPAGVALINPAFVTPDGRHYVYSFRRVLSDLYLAEGLR